MTNNEFDKSVPIRARLLDINEASEALRISRWSMYQLINQRRIKTIRLRGRRLITPEDLDAFVAGLRDPEGLRGAEGSRDE
jgi:excisionase family DNA binding protein